MTIRRALPADKVSLEKIRSCYFGPFLSWSEAELASQVDSGSVWVLVDEGRNSGEVMGYISDRRAGDDIEILSLALAPQYRGKGMMRFFIQKLYLTQDKAAQHKHVFLEVHERNQQAISMYQALGFELIGLRPDYYSDGGKALVFQR